MKLLDRILSQIDKEYYVTKMRMKGAKIGKNFFFQGSYIDSGFPFLIEIGDNVTLTNATILAHDASTYNIIGKSRVGKVKIGNNVFIGYQSIILPNVSIGDNVVIGAGSIVSRSIPDNSVAVGNPCRVIETYTEFCKKHEKFLKEHPVYPTYHSKKGPEEIAKMQLELEDTWGYDE